MSEEKQKILLVDDDDVFGFILKKFLEAKNFLVDKINNSKEAYALFNNHTYDLCLLDVMMPLKDGFTLAKEIKAKVPDMPIIFITANSIKEQTLIGFDAGADDYIRKPFEMEELFLRMQAILRRSVKPQVHSDNDFANVAIGQYTFNFNTHTLTLGKNKRKLTTKEAQLLHLLVLNQNQLLIHSVAMQSVWHHADHLTHRSMDVFITKLRKYLIDDPNVEILNARGQGYKLLVKS
ncbi:MAG TPA: response regulator transcription factor [Bacteroidia bacterium]|jgi:DNA-binding response OmpR family regulator|nr:response regulator transcription factor [Bacteroidia bacterium]